MTGLGYDQNVTGPLTNLDILFAPDYAGRLTFLTEMRDTVGLAALRLGPTPRPSRRSSSRRRWHRCRKPWTTAPSARSPATATSTTWLPATWCWRGLVGRRRGNAGPGADRRTGLPVDARRPGRHALDRQHGPSPRVPRTRPRRRRSSTGTTPPRTPPRSAPTSSTWCPVKGADEAIAAIDPALGHEHAHLPRRGDARSACTSSGASTWTPRRLDERVQRGHRALTLGRPSGAARAR